MDGSTLQILPLVNGFHNSLRAGLLSGWPRIVDSTIRHWLLWFARCISQWMAAYCSYFHWLSAFTTVCAHFCYAVGGGLLVHTLVKPFHNGLHTVLLSGWEQIAHSSACQRFSHQFMRCIAQRMAADCSFFHLSTAFTGCSPFFLADGRTLLMLSFGMGFYGLHAILLSRWHRSAHTSVCQWLSQWFAPHITHSYGHLGIFRHFSYCITRRIAQHLDGGGSPIIRLSMTLLTFHAL